MDHKALMPVRLERVALWSPVKHSSAELPQTGYTNKSVLEILHIAMGAANAQTITYKCAVLLVFTACIHKEWKWRKWRKTETKKITSSPPG